MHHRLVATLLLSLALTGCGAGAPSTSKVAPTARPSASAGASVIAGTAASLTAAPAPAAVVAPPVAPTAARPTDPPAPRPPVAKVEVLPANSGPVGSPFLLWLTGFPPGRVVETITDPNGMPKSAFVTAGADGSASVTFQRTQSDQPGVGKYTLRFDSGPVSVSTVIEVTP